MQMRQNSGSKKTQGFDKTQGILPKIGLIFTKFGQFEAKFCMFLQNFAEIRAEFDIITRKRKHPCLGGAVNAA